jgi:hypothetical protein
VNKFDHLKLVQRQPREVRRFRDWIAARQGAGGLCENLIEHEHDLSCCRRELWPATLRHVLAGLPFVTVHLFG